MVQNLVVTKDNIHTQITTLDVNLMLNLTHTKPLSITSWHVQRNSKFNKKVFPRK